MTDAGGRLDSLRRLMKDRSVDYYIVPSTDAHASEYIGPCDRRLAFLSSFTGSAGTAVVSQREALLFTDSRYWVQAGQQLDPKLWALRKVASSQANEGDDWKEWLAKNAATASVGVDPHLISNVAAKAVSATLEANLVYPVPNLVDQIWPDRPSRSLAPLVLHPIRFTGRHALSKISFLKSSLPSTAAGYVSSSLPDIMWLLNLRGSDIPYNPLAFCHLWIPRESDQTGTIFVDAAKISEEVERYLAHIGLQVRPYDEVSSAFLSGETGAVVADLGLCLHVARSLEKSGHELVQVPSPIEREKAVKNETELDGMRAAYRRDAKAWAEWAAWMSKATKKRGAKMTEWEAAEELTARRQKLENYVGLAYGNISATNANAALPHYAPSKEKSSLIDRETPYLNDSGPQYLDGTIDTTRTYHFGRPTLLQKQAYTAVLKGHIAVATAQWPESAGVNGMQLDALARLENLKLGFGYGHGTGHGVGSYLGVHEGPQGLGPSTVWASNPLVHGHCVSIEPGHYREGEFGIRIESIYAVVEAGEKLERERWLGFERLTQVPIATNLVDFGMMTPPEIRWLRRHNTECRHVVAASLPSRPSFLARLCGPHDGDANTNQRTLKWLRKQCNV